MLKFLFVKQIIPFCLLFSVACSSPAEKAPDQEKYICHVVDLETEKIDFYWKDDSGRVIGNAGNLKKLLAAKGHQLRFAMNGGMYQFDQSPKGLYIENFNTLKPLDRLAGVGNFYLKPNGIFFITAQNNAGISTTQDFDTTLSIRHATQSGPMLLINNRIHPAFNPASSNRNIRNGVGMLPGNKVVFVLSKAEVTFYDFASYFKRLGCRHALYLDGFVSRMYLPGKQWIQTDGNLGVIIGVTTSSQ